MGASTFFPLRLFHLILTYAVTCSLLASLASAKELRSDEEMNKVLSNLANRIIKEGGYVNKSIQLASPAPCGADRGVIIAKENGGNSNADEGTGTGNIWLRVPFSYQLTRDLALETLTPLISRQVLEVAPLVTLDDAALLVLLLVHLRGLSVNDDDKWHPYLVSLPDDPGCGWWDNGDTEIAKQLQEVIVPSREYVGRVSQGMAMDYGPYLANEHWPKEWKGMKSNSEDEYDMILSAAANAIKWSLCIVSSRGTAASPTFGGGSVRLVPLADMFNHNLGSDGFMELTEKDVGSKKEILGSFEVRRNKAILPGEEITVDYTLDGYMPEDWFLSHGFVPSEVFGQSGRSEL